MVSECNQVYLKSLKMCQQFKITNERYILTDNSAEQIIIYALNSYICHLVKWQIQLFIT